MIAVMSSKWIADSLYPEGIYNAWISLVNIDDPHLPRPHRMIMVVIGPSTTTLLCRLVISETKVTGPRTI